MSKKYPVSEAPSTATENEDTPVAIAPTAATDSAPSHGRTARRSTPMYEQTYYSNPCCGDCALHEGVDWISAFEFVWGLIFAITCLSLIATSNNAKRRVEKMEADNNGASASEDDKEWKKYGHDHGDVLLASIILHTGEFILGIFLMIAASRRFRKLCIAWIIGISLVIVGEVATVIIHPFSMTYLMVGINPLRLYFIFIVWSLASEITKFPAGAPVTRVLQPIPLIQTVVQRPVYSSPIVVPAYGYPAYGYGYGYGYPYGGYYGADAALTGMAIGAGVGMGGGYYGGDYYGGGGYYDDNFF